MAGGVDQWFVLGCAEDRRAGGGGGGIRLRQSGAGTRGRGAHMVPISHDRRVRRRLSRSRLLGVPAKGVLVMKKSLLALAVAAVLALPALAKTDAQSLIPNDAVTVGVVHLDELRSSPLSIALFQQTDKIASDGDAAQFLLDAGLKPSQDIDVIVVATTLKTALGKDADVVIAADGRFNVDRLSAALVTRGAVKSGGYYILPEKKESSETSKRGAVAFPNGHLAIVGTEEAVKNALAAYAAGGPNFATAGALGHDMSRIDPKATAWALVDVVRAQRIVGSPHVPAGSQAGVAV